MAIISVFDMLKIGIGPSSSHTLGPWKAANRFSNELINNKLITKTENISVELFGSLSLTGKGHATDIACMMGLSTEKPEEILPEKMEEILRKIETESYILISGNRIPFLKNRDIVFHKNFLPFHPNGMKITASGPDFMFTKTYFSLGGGFVTEEGEDPEKADNQTQIPYPIQTAAELLEYCKTGKSISEVVWENELSLHTEPEVRQKIAKIWLTMQECMYLGCHTAGHLPGGLNVKRRAADIYKKLKGPADSPIGDWLTGLRKTEVKFREILQWVSCFALSVNEVNASLGRVVTAPTNGSAGVIPAVLMYYLMIENHDAAEDEIRRFMLVAGEIGSIFKKGATISAAMGGCQAEIGVSAAMAAGALCELQGGTPGQVLVAAEIAMEHHLGLTCDPIAGLVQVPCIERNAMGAIKAINAAELALNTNPDDTKVSLDHVIATMWKTALDMNQKYKETSQGGLAVTVNNSDC
ncbi:MAG: L-serine ammonia-lyase [Cytophagaceae bacterium]|nr:L-serine ammonia-lyase [Cytophagaceae bacterium]MBL0302916.1 L-serine ammonia-lyase [Cytophagaceae bacterium]MBL0325746.1 L-serine ammonia-lyase [Cytophagaceae bacterium]